MASSLAASANVTLCVEPLNPVDFPGYLVPDCATALRVLEQVDEPHCKLQLDLYHVAMGAGEAHKRMADLLVLSRGAAAAATHFAAAARLLPHDVQRR